MRVDTVLVLGANGTMGRNVSGIFASFGQAKVYMMCRDRQQAESAIEKAIASVKAESIRKRLIPCDYTQMETICGRVDLVYESVAENFELKYEILKNVSHLVGENTTICTGTSGLSVTRLAEALRPEQRKHFLGMHMFNPPYSMPLCEIISGKSTDPTTAQAVAEYASVVLRRATVYVKDVAAFLANRIGFYVINDAFIQAKKHEHNGGIDYIDSILGCYTGRNMPPLATADFVGLDTHIAIVDNLYEKEEGYFKESFVVPEFLRTLVHAGKKGLKAGEGIYKSIRGPERTCQRLVYDVKEGEYRPIIQYHFPFKEEMIRLIRVGNYEQAIKVLKNNCSLEAVLCLQMLLKYILYATYCSSQISDTIHAADVVMLAGFNWVPPIALMWAFGGPGEVIDLAEEHLGKQYVEVTRARENLMNVGPSKYDFRQCLKGRD